MSQLEVNKIVPQSGTSLTYGDNGDTFQIPSGVTLDIASGGTIDATGATITGFDAASDEKVKISSNDTTPGFLNGKLTAGANITLTEGSDGGDETLSIALSGTIPDARFPATLPAASGVNLTALNASNLGSGTVPTARLGSGTASSSTFLAGDQTFKTVTGTTINTNADDRVITGSGSANTLNGEANLIFDGSKLGVNVTPVRSFHLHDDTQPYFHMSNNTTGTTTGDGFDIIIDASTGKAILNNRENQPIEWMTNNQVRMHLTGSGNLGIGTASPSFPLHVSGKIYGTGVVASAGNSFELSDNNVTVKRATNDMTLNTAGTERIRIDSSGNVGIGNGSPQVNFVVGDGTNGTGLEVTPNDSSAFVNMNAYDRGNSAWRTMNIGGDVVTLNTGGTERMRIDGSGHVLPGATNTYDLGSTSKVWRNIYTSDLNMSNEGLDKGNDVDGTKGSWTFQEGSDDLFLLNNKNGKKYKFKLEECK